MFNWLVSRATVKGNCIRTYNLSYSPLEGLLKKALEESVWKGFLQFSQHPKLLKSLLEVVSINILDVGFYHQPSRTTPDIMFTATARRLIQYVGNVQLGHITDPAWYGSVKSFCETIEQEVSAQDIAIGGVKLGLMDFLGPKDHESGN